MLKLIAISLAILAVLFGPISESSAAVVTHETHRWTFGPGWTEAGYYCDFKLEEGVGRVVGRYTFIRRDGQVVRSIDHEVRRGSYINASTGAVVTTMSRYTITSRFRAPYRVTGAFMQIRAADGTLLFSASGNALIDFIHDQYVFLHRTHHATLVPQFTYYPPGICEMLGGHQVVP